MSQTRIQTEAQRLAAALRERTGADVRFGRTDRALYATDASNYRQVPIGVVLPRTQQDVIETVAVCREFHAPVLPRGAGTSLAGQGCNAAVVIDMSRYLRQILAVDPERRTARVQPGVVLDHLRADVQPHGLTFGPDPATHTHCTLGGMIGNNSCGTHSLMSGMTDANIENMDVLLYDGTRLQVGPVSERDLEHLARSGGRVGEIYSRLRTLRDRYATDIRTGFPNIPRRVSGYNLPWLLAENGCNLARALVGSEGTCVTVLEAEVRLVHNPPFRCLLVLGYEDSYRAGDHVAAVLETGPIALEGFSGPMVNDVRRAGLDLRDVALLPSGGGWLVAEYGGASPQEAEERAREAQMALQRAGAMPRMQVFADPLQQKCIWLVRDSALGATTDIPGEPRYWPGWEDSAVPPDRLGGYLRDLRALQDRYGYGGAFYGHFGEGCIHVRIDFDLRTTQGIEHFDAFMRDAADLVVSYGGSLSGEHGDGQARGELLPRMFSPALMQAFAEFKSVWDPENRMNPGKLVDPYRMDANLRLDTPLRVLDTYFQYPQDGGSFAEATTRCIGIGRCRRTEGGTMCPSYMVTRAEEHSTRGRAHLLFEMMAGTPIAEGWESAGVKEALDLCLACKGCKSDCPMHVDVATYKAEFLAHYYRTHRRPRSAYSMGLIGRWAPLGARAPGVVNVLTATPVVERLAKTIAGIAQQRSVPRLASQTFRSWFQKRGARNLEAPPVLLWPDTFNNHFHPEVARAAVEVLEAAGFGVILPDRPLCCGRPLYDFGFLDTARAQLQDVLASLGPVVHVGVPVVVLEPSCASVFRDELLNLFPQSEDAHRVASSTYLLSEFLQQYAPEFPLPTLSRSALVHVHCHHRGVLGTGAEEAVLDRMGLDANILDSGCCGMAGAFGFEAEHVAISQAVGERVLLPAVRSAPGDTLVITNGFSCREQIAQGTGRRALHLAEVLRLGLASGADSGRTTVVTDNPRRLSVLLALVLLGAGLWWKGRGPSHRGYDRAGERTI